MLLAAALRREKVADETIAQQAADLEQLSRLVGSSSLSIVVGCRRVLTGCFVSVSSAFRLTYENHLMCCSVFRLL
jgi:hypothetical protein